MNTRTVLYVILVTVVFFGLNIFFSYQRDQQNREALAKKEALESKRQAVLESEIAARSVQLSDLPLVTLDGTDEQAVQLGSHLITLAWTKSQPTSVSYQGKSFKLMTENPVVGAPVLYATEPFQPLDIAPLPSPGISDLQLLTFEHGKVEVHLAEYHEGSITFLSEPVKSNALALYKSGSSWVPAGFYEWRGKVFLELQDLPSFTALIKAAPIVQADQNQQYYVLENETVQLVFTNVGGSLAEINLPLRSEKDQKSVVNPIGFDRQIVEDSPANAHFPAHPYYTPGDSQLHQSGQIGGYYPLIRRGIVLKNQHVDISPQFYATNIVSDYPEMAELSYSVSEFSKERIVFVGTQPHRKITKTYTIAPKEAPYTFDLDIRIEGDARGLWIGSGIPEVEIMSNSSSPRIQYRTMRKGKGEVDKLGLPKQGEVVSSSTVRPEWMLVSNGYLGMILNPLKEIGDGYKAIAIPGTAVPTRLAVIDPKYQPYPPAKYPGYEILLPLPSKGGSFSFRVYSGPFEEKTLKAVDRIFSDKATGYNPDYAAARTFYGWFSFISKPFAKLLFVVMQFFYMITSSWGVAIILLTVFLRLLLYPLNAWSIKSMRRMQKLSPTIQAIQKKYKKDPKRAQMEIMQIYREKKVNPFMGCVPILIQIPFLIAMFDLLKSSFQLRGASFIPGWIDNLTAPDVLFSWQAPIFFFGTQFHLLPFLLGATMFFQQRLSASGAPKDPEKMSDQQRQQRAMGTIMTIVFTVMFYNFPSGLNLYWLSSMLLGILQQWITNKMLDKKGEKPELITRSAKK